MATALGREDKIVRSGRFAEWTTQRPVKRVLAYGRRLSLCDPDSGMARIQRTAEEMVKRLRINVDLLDTYIKRVQAGETEYLGEAAGKCRVLVLKTGANRPLLQTLARLTGHGLRIEAGALLPGMHWEEGIGGEEMIDIERWLDMMAGAFQTPSSGGQVVSITPRALVQTWAEQSGAAHEDWGQEETFHVARSMGVHIGGVQATELQMLQVAIKVRSIGLNYLNVLRPEIIAGAEVRRQAKLAGEP